MGMPPAHVPTAEESKGFFAGLFDFSFTNLVTPKVIKVLYILFLVGLALATLGGIGAILLMLIDGNILKALGFMVALPILLVLYLILGRVYHELIILAFRMLETLEAIKKNTGG